MDASQITKLLQKQNNRFINRSQTVDSSTLIWKNQIESSKYIKGVKTCEGEQNWNVPTNPGCPVGNGICSFGGSGRTTSLQTGSPQQFLNVLSGASGSASQVYSSESITLQRAGKESCGVPGVSPAPLNSYVVLPACYCVDTNGPTSSVSSELSNSNPLPINNQSNPYLPAFDTYYAMKNPGAQCIKPVQDQNQKHFVKQCHSRFPNANNGVNAVFSPCDNVTRMDPDTKQFYTYPINNPDTCDGCILENPTNLVVSNECINNTTIESLGNQDIYVYHTLNQEPNCGYTYNTIGFSIQGSGIINWGDGTSESFDIPDESQIITHTYPEFTNNCMNYIIGITGNIINLYLRQVQPITLYYLGSGCNDISINVTNVIFNNNIASLTGFSLYNSELNGLLLVPSLTLLYLNSMLNFDVTILNNLPNLVNLTLSGTISGNFDVSGLSQTISTLNLLNNSSLIDILNLDHLINLEQLSIQDSLINDIDLSNNTTLTFLSISNTSVSATSILPFLIQLEQFGAADTQLTSIDLSNNPQLYNLEISNNQLTSIDLSSNTLLTELKIFNNQLPTIDLSNNTLLTNLVISNNQLTSIDLSNNTLLSQLYIYNNNLMQNNADNIALTLVNNNIIDGMLGIIQQVPGPIDITGPDYVTLQDRNWNID